MSEDIICNRRFDSESNDWHNSELAKWLAVEFTEEAFFSSEYCQLVPLKCTDKGKFGYKLFLLSEAEYIGSIVIKIVIDFLCLVLEET